MTRLILIVALVLVAALTAWLLAGDDDGGSPAPAPNGEALRIDRPLDGAEETRRGEVEHGVDADVAEVPSGPRRTAAADPSLDCATIVGRCVEPAGEPLAGVEVELRARPETTMAFERDLLEHGPLDERFPLREETGPDGRFVFTFDPPEEHRYVVGLRLPGHVAGTLDGLTLDASREAPLDLGDLVVPAGVVVSGQVVDRGGVPVAGARIDLQRVRPSGVERSDEDPASATVLLHSQIRVGAGQDGIFTTTVGLPPGSYKVGVSGRETLDPSDEVELDGPSANLAIVVEIAGPPEETGPPIEGIVVDESGRPLPGVHVTAAPDPEGRGFGGWRPTLAESRPDGAFRIARRRRDDHPGYRLRFERQGYEPFETAEVVAWGTDGRRIVMRSGPALTILVRDADRGDAPVERFGIRMTWGRTRRDARAINSTLSHVDTHAGGQLTIPRLTSGELTLQVVPAPSTGLPPSGRIELTLEAGTPQTLDVSLHRYAERIVVVRAPSGRTVTGSYLELVESLTGDTIELTTSIYSADASISPFGQTHPAQAALWQRTQTDATGRATLRAPRDRGYALRLLGPGHPAFVVQPVSLDPERPLEVTTPPAATLHITARPPEALAELLAEIDDEQQRPKVWLSRENDREVYPPRPPGQWHGFAMGVPLTANGRTTIDGIPPGRWNLQLLTLDRAGSTEGQASRRTVVRDLQLAAEETREVQIDLSRMLGRGTTLVVLADGQPFEGRVDLVGFVGAGNRYQARHVETDAHGRATVELPVGNWRPQVTLDFGGGGAMVRGAAFRIDDGVGQEITIQLRTGFRPVRVFDAAGEPAHSINLTFEGPVDVHGRGGSPVDAEGRAVLRGTAGAVRVTAQARRQFVPSDPRQRPAAWLLGDVQLLPGGGTEVELRLPVALGPDGGR
jgi:hypothetical protein